MDRRFDLDYKILKGVEDMNSHGIGADDGSTANQKVTNEDIDGFLVQGTQELTQVIGLESLELWRLRHLGRSSAITGVLRGLGSLAVDQRRAIGAAGNVARKSLETAYESSLAELKKTAIEENQQRSIDITMPGRVPEVGRLHPTVQIVREIADSFSSMGFQVLEGPEVEWDKYNFEALNIPQDHPARDMWDTLWIDQADSDGVFSMLLRTHTSPMQARVMENSAPPIRVLVPGKCYRYEATDPTHEWHFYQIEGLAVDEGITFAHLKGTLYEFARQIFGRDRKIRFRCDYFPFVEPGVDVSIDCFKCDGKGCRVCAESGWIEIMGAGMVHPKVLERAGYDSKKYTGFAFGMGPERIAMLKYGIDDIRHFYTNDLRFLAQF
jgi:phenylalanyl-tRNA synthetase alpha chain